MNKITFIIIFLFIVSSLNLYSQWIPVGLGTPLGGDINELKVYNSKMYAGGTVTLFRSTDNGNNWNGCIQGFALYAWNITKNNYAIYCGLGSPTMYYSTNDGETWTQMTTFPPLAGSIWDIECDNNFIYAQTTMYFLKSSNNGQNWVTENNPGGFVLFYSNDRLYSAGVGLKVSTNNGSNWTVIFNQPTTSIFVEDSVIFAGSQDNGLYRSGNYGQNFINIIPGYIRVNAIYKYNDYVFVAADTMNPPFYTAHNLYVSTNKGFSFIKRNQGLDSVSITSFIYHNNYIYISVGNYGTTNVSIYKRLLQDIIGIKKYEGVIPESFELYQNYPNPFNKTTIIKFQTKSNGLVELKIFDLSGKIIKTLINENLNAGLYQVEFDSESLTSGVYFYKLVTNGFESVKKMILVK